MRINGRGSSSGCGPNSARTSSQLVRAGRVRGGRQGHGLSFGADPVPEILDPVALSREAAGAVAGERDIVAGRAHSCAATAREPQPPAAAPRRRQSPAPPGRSPPPSAVPSPPRARPSRDGPLGGSPVDPRYTFETFCEGAANRVAFAAARAVAETPTGKPTAVQPALHPCRRRPRQDPPSPRHHARGAAAPTGPQGASTSPPSTSCSASSRRCATSRRSRSRRACARSTSCSSTTCSSCRANRCSRSSATC